MLSSTDINVEAPDVQEQHVVRRTKYTPEFRSEAARLVVREGNKLTDVAKRLHVPDQTLSNWVRKERHATLRKANPNVQAAQTPSNVRDRLEIERLKEEVVKQTARAEIFEKTMLLLVREGTLASI